VFRPYSFKLVSKAHFREWQQIRDENMAVWWWGRNPTRRVQVLFNFI